MASMSQRYVPRPDDGWDETRETIDGFTTVEASFYPGRYPEPYKYPVRYEGPSQDSFEHMAPSLSPFEVTDLVRSVVEKGRQETQRSLAGNEGISEAVELKLTIDLGHQNIQTIPDEVVNIIKDEVARYVSFALSRYELHVVPQHGLAIPKYGGYCMSLSTNSYADFPYHTIKFGTSLTNSRNVPS